MLAYDFNPYGANRLYLMPPSVPGSTVSCKLKCTTLKVVDSFSLVDTIFKHVAGLLSIPLEALIHIWKANLPACTGLV